MNANPFWSDLVHELTPYVPGEQPKQGQTFIKLNSNESPYPPSPKVLQAIVQATTGQLRLYPNSVSSPVCQTVATYYGLQADQVFASNGSDEALAHTFCGLFKHAGKKILMPNISYSFYPVYAKLFGIEYTAVPLTSTMQLDLTPYKEASDQDYSAIIFPNPNAPTSLALGLEAIESLLKAQPNMVVVVDEAYVDFGAESATSLIQHYPNLLVIQTLSKSRSLAGMRVGLAMGQASLLQALIRVKDSFNSYPVDTLAQAAACAAFQDEAYFQEKVQAIIADRAFLTQGLRQLGFTVLDSKANFVFARHSTVKAVDITQALRQAGILVRHFKQPLIEGYLRITIGLHQECETLLKALRQILL